jgi:hypothetical protein
MLAMLAVWRSAATLQKFLLRPVYNAGVWCQLAHLRGSVWRIAEKS